MNIGFVVDVEKVMKGHMEIVVVNEEEEEEEED